MKVTAVAVACAAVILVAACGGDDDDTSGTDTGSDDGGVHTVALFESVSTELVDGYNADNPDNEVTVVVGSQDEAIAAATDGGLAILPTRWLSEAGLEGTVLGRTEAVIVVPAGNPAQVTGVDAFAAGASADVRACGAETQYGNFAEAVIRLGGVVPDPARVGTGCAAEAVDQVAQGQLDGALVFPSEVTIPSDVDEVDIPEDENFVVDLSYAHQGDADADFVEWLGSDAAGQVLAQSGYGF